MYWLIVLILNKMHEAYWKEMFINTRCECTYTRKCNWMSDVGYTVPFWQLSLYKCVAKHRGCGYMHSSSAIMRPHQMTYPFAASFPSFIKWSLGGFAPKFVVNVSCNCVGKWLGSVLMCVSECACSISAVLFFSATSHWLWESCPLTLYLAYLTVAFGSF